MTIFIMEVFITSLVHCPKTNLHLSMEQSVYADIFFVLKVKPSNNIYNIKKPFKYYKEL